MRILGFSSKINISSCTSKYYTVDKIAMLCNDESHWKKWCQKLHKTAIHFIFCKHWFYACSIFITFVVSKIVWDLTKWHPSYLAFREWVAPDCECDIIPHTFFCHKNFAALTLISPTPQISCHMGLFNICHLICVVNNISES